MIEKIDDIRLDTNKLKILTENYKKHLKELIKLLKIKK